MSDKAEAPKAEAPNAEAPNARAILEKIEEEIPELGDVIKTMESSMGEFTSSLGEAFGTIFSSAILEGLGEKPKDAKTKEEVAEELNSKAQETFKPVLESVTKMLEKGIPRLGLKPMPLKKKEAEVEKSEECQEEPAEETQKEHRAVDEVDELD